MYSGLVPDDSNKMPDIIRRAEGNEPALRLSLQYKKAMDQYRKAQNAPKIAKTKDDDNNNSRKV